MRVLRFPSLHRYRSGETSITIPVKLRAGRRETEVLASVDTGASHCLFQRVLAELVGIDVPAGQKTRFWTANSSFDAYGHEVEIEAAGILTYSFVYFFADAEIRKNVLGRQGWLDRVRLGIVDYDSELYLGPYDFE